MTGLWSRSWGRAFPIGFWGHTWPWWWLRSWRKRGLWTMVCASPAGRLGLPVWRLGAVALGALLGSAVLTCTELSHAYWMYGGLSELGRVLQSVSSFQDFTYPMTIGSFWLLYLLLRALGAFLLGLTLWFLQEAIADRRLVGAVWVLVLGGEYALYRRLPGTALLQKVNLFSCLHLRALVTGYCNLNLFGHPVGQLPLVLWAGLLLGALMLPGIGCIYRFRKPVSGYGWVNRLLDRVRSPLPEEIREQACGSHTVYIIVPKDCHCLSPLQGKGNSSLGCGHIRHQKRVWQRAVTI